MNYQARRQKYYCYSFILAYTYCIFARLYDDDEGAAKTDVTESTLEEKDYPHPTNSHIKFGDLPGIGMYLTLILN